MAETWRKHGCGCDMCDKETHLHIDPKLDRLMKRLSRKLVAAAKESRVEMGDGPGQTFFDFSARRG